MRLGRATDFNHVVELGLESRRLFELEILRVTHLDDERFHSCQSSRYGLDHAHDGFHFGTTTGRFRHVGHSREEETMEKR